MKAILVSSGDDYAALQFEDTFSGTSVKEIIDNLSNYENEDSWEIEVVEVGNIDPLFISFIRDNIQDYDDSKHTNFWLDYETI